MVKKYKIMRIDEATLINFKNKKIKMNNNLKSLGIKNKSVSMIDIVKMVSSKPLILGDEEIVNLAKQGKRIRKI